MAKKIHKNLYTISTSILEKFFKDGRFNKDMLSKTNIDRVVKALDEGITKNIKSTLTSLSREVRMKLKKEYNKFMRKGVFTVNPTIQKYKIQDLKPKYLKELLVRQDVALSYIKTRIQQDKEDIKNRLMNYASLPHLEANEEDLKESLWEGVFPDNIKERYKTDKWTNFIIRDQAHKLNSNLSYITARDNDAIGFIWKNKQDIRVVGNPSGLYPKGNEMHNNHWDRENKLYLFRGSSYLNKGYIIKNDLVDYADEIEDGLPGQAINCRCTMRMIYRIYEIPEKYKSIITDKGAKLS